MMRNIQLLIAALLLLCLFNLPYGFYILIRFLSAIAFAFFAYHYYEKKKETIAITFGALALLFQPFFKIAIGRELWILVDIIAAALLIILAIKEKKQSS